MPPHLLRLLLNVQTCFPYSATPSTPSQKTPAWALTPSPTQALALLSPTEKEKILRFYFPRDAALALGSSLLKRVAVVKGLKVSWEEAGRGMGREKRGKPYWRRPGSAAAVKEGESGEERTEGDEPGVEDVDREIEFNVSHHGSLVVLIASITPNAGEYQQSSSLRAHRVGIDVTKIDLMRDTAAVQHEGSFAIWVNIYGDVFHPSELRTLTSLPDSLPLEDRLRRFYTSWALREAYVKMTGEALLAAWLKELEFREVRAPVKGLDGGWGEGWTGVEVWVKEERVNRVEVEISGWGKDYVVASVVEGWEKGWEEWVQFEEVDFARDIAPLAKG
ncbi:hypothetical protein MMC30_003328 [Trapelia coarctata]|nr:hypothetical protein [Trapelia coarctata]